MKDIYEKIGRRLVRLSTAGVLNFAAKGKATSGKKKNCTEKSWSCGFSCISRSKKCSDTKEGQAKTYTDYLASQAKMLAGAAPTAKAPAPASKASPIVSPQVKGRSKEEPVASPGTVTPTLKPKPFNPNAISDLSVESFFEHRTNKEVIDRTKDPAAAWNQDYASWSRGNKSRTKSEYKLALTRAIADEIPVPREAITAAGIKLNKRQQQQLADNEKAFAEKIKSVDEIDRAINHPLVEDAVAAKHKPFMSKADAAHTQRALRLLGWGSITGIPHLLRIRSPMKAQSQN